MKQKFRIDILSKRWINGTNKTTDLCLHGDVRVIINSIPVIDEYECTISSTALYLLKSLKDNHIVGEKLNQLFPHCGNLIIHEAGKEDVDIIGCNIGEDLTIIHIGALIHITYKKDISTFLDYKTYEKIVFDFVDEVIAFYESEDEKIFYDDKYQIDGYKKYWNLIIKLRKRESTIYAEDR